MTNKKRTTPKRTIIVNLFAPPNRGKALMAHKVCDNLLTRGVSCSVVSHEHLPLETARYSDVQNEIFIFARDFNKIFRLHGHVEVIVTDKPLMMSLFYNIRYGQGYYQRLNDLIIEQNANLYNMNFFLKGESTTAKHDLTQSEINDIEIDMEAMLRAYRNEYTSVDVGDIKSVDMISNAVYKEVLTYREEEAGLNAIEVKLDEEKKERE